MTHPQAWSMITVGDSAQYAGHSGYADDLRRVYAYDSNVANHKNVEVGDLVLLRDKKRLLGIARIEEIRKQPGTKLMRRCPSCGISAIKERVSKHPRFRCNTGHVFEAPLEDSIPVHLYEAHFAKTFVEAPDAIPVGHIKAATPRPSDQLSIERVDIARLEKDLLSAFPNTRSILASFYQSMGLTSDEAADDGLPEIGNATPDAASQYVPSMADSREAVLKAIRQRRGQQKFRRRLISRYGSRCAISGCCILDVLEAAHVWPYRGESDHHVDNGLLLRADLHTLFDLNLLAIDPENLAVEIAPVLMHEAEYANFRGRKLLVPKDARPAQGPLEKRWAHFQSEWAKEH